MGILILFDKKVKKNPLYRGLNTIRVRDGWRIFLFLIQTI